MVGGDDDELWVQREALLVESEALWVAICAIVPSLLVGFYGAHIGEMGMWVHTIRLLNCG